MHTTNGSRPKTLAALAVTMLLALARSATAQAPDFDAVAWAPLACQAAEPAGLPSTR